MPASSIFSKQVNKKRVQKLKELFTTFHKNKEEKLKRGINKKKQR
jgi:hypothetical protein